MSNNCAIELKNITKRFGIKVLANDNISLSVNYGEILSLLGENGSGKTTLMNMISGIYQPDSGVIYKDGKEISIRSPKDAFKYKIGMIHQHYKLVNVFSAAQNIVLGLDEKEGLNIASASEKIKEICSTYGFNLNPDMKVYDMSVSEKQTVEIVKVLYRGADVLILDEPTAVLTPQEAERLFNVLRNMKKAGKAVVIITHKLAEVMEISDKVAVLRKGKYIGTVNTCDTNPQALTDMMVGHAVSLNINRPLYDDPKPKLVVENLTVVDHDGIVKLDNVSFTANSGEILGIAGISGSGQKELLESISGLCKVKKGSISYLRKKGPIQLVGKTPMQIRATGVGMAFVPEDRLGMGLVGSMGMTSNMMIRSWKHGRGVFLDRKSPSALAKEIKEELEVVTPSIEYPVRRLSGGNIQKVLVGREISLEPKVLMTAYAVRGLDINTSYTIYNLLTKEKMKGVAVIYVGEELDVLLALCDRILVLCDGKVSGIVDGRKTTKEEIGLLMTGKGSEK